MLNYLTWSLHIVILEIIADGEDHDDQQKTRMSRKSNSNFILFNNAKYKKQSSKEKDTNSKQDDKIVE
jgi:hypothetical protein